MEEPEDPPGQEYDFEVRLIDKANGMDATVVLSGQFSFDPERILHRHTIIGVLPPFSKGGVFIVESRVRKIGDTSWKTQDYPIPIEVVSPPKEPAAKEKDKTKPSN
jgi:hypothetical protein